MLQVCTVVGISALVERLVSTLSYMVHLSFIALTKPPGQMGDLNTSPADPLFHLHHANLDRLWWSWQSLNLPARLSDISGPSIMMNPASPNVTLAHPLSVGVSGVDTTVGDVMKIDACGTGGSMCYTYDSLYTLL